MSNAPKISRCDIDAYRTWRAGRVAPAYLRGMPTWMWQSALRCSPARRRTAAVT